MDMEMEEKTFSFEIKALTEEGQFEGYAAIFGKPDDYGEIIEKGAFTKTLKERTQFPMLWYHDPRNPIGVADVEVDKKGLKVIGQLNLEVQAAKEKHSLMKQKAIRGLSIGFRTITDTWNDNMRILKEIKLFEISPATFQVHPKALIRSVKSMSFESNLESLERVKAYLEHSIHFSAALSDLGEVKAGKVISASNMKLINNAVKALVDLLAKTEPSKDTQAVVKSLIPESIGKLGQDEKPQEHFFLEDLKIPTS